jgi:Galactose oxidase, central domain
MSARINFPVNLLVFALSASTAISISGCNSSGSSSPTPGSYTVGGTVSGLTGNGLVLQINAGGNLAVRTNGSFSFSTPLQAGGAYLATVLTQPSNPAESCVVTNAAGSIVLADVSNLQVTCSAVPASAPAISTAQNQWTWAGGATVPNQAGVYGTQGTPSVANIPGARTDAVSWTDLSGNLWLFGGVGPSVGGGCHLMETLCWAGTAQFYNDLWKFDGSEWTWVGGSYTASQKSVYGTMGSAAAGNMPGARYGAVSWRDAADNFWLFGGIGIDSKGETGPLNELWEYSGGQWTWVGGANTINQPGQYGTQGSPAAGNFPGSRAGAIAFADWSGNVWLFGGQGCDSTSDCGSVLDDLWEYTGGQWAWISGSNVAYPAQAGVYGAEGVASPGYHPGGRYNSMGWTDNSGDLWTFGGAGYNTDDQNVAELNDFWTHSNAGWAWMGGSSSVVDATGTYGTMGTPAPGNIPGSRDSAMTWTDANGNLWLFGGEGLGATGGGYFNDLWMYDGTEWTWVGGSNTGGQQGVYGTLGVPTSGNIPGSRLSAVTWTDARGNLWLFGGENTSGLFNDLWVYQP